MNTPAKTASTSTACLSPLSGSLPLSKPAGVQTGNTYHSNSIESTRGQATQVIERGGPSYKINHQFGALGTYYLVADKYASAAEALMEGGSVDKRGTSLKNVCLEDFLTGKSKYFAVAGDPRYRYGTNIIVQFGSNREEILKVAKHYFGVFQGKIPMDVLVSRLACANAKIVDTGGAFRGAGSTHLDIATRDRYPTKAMTTKLQWSVVKEHPSIIPGAGFVADFVTEQWDNISSTVKGLVDSKMFNPGAFLTFMKTQMLSLAEKISGQPATEGDKKKADEMLKQLQVGQFAPEQAYALLNDYANKKQLSGGFTHSKDDALVFTGPVPKIIKATDDTLFYPQGTKLSADEEKYTKLRLERESSWFSEKDSSNGNWFKKAEVLKLRKDYGFTRSGSWNLFE